MKKYKTIAIIMSIIGMWSLFLTLDVSIAQGIRLGTLAGDHIAMVFGGLLLIAIIYSITGLIKGNYKYILHSGIISLPYPIIYIMLYFIRTINYPSIHIRWHVVPSIFIPQILLITAAMIYKKSQEQG